MKKQISTFIMTFSLFGTLAVASAQAQFDEKIGVEVPFNFQIAADNLPAGDYLIEPISFGGAQLYFRLLLSSKDGQTRKIVPTLPIQSATIQEKSKLIFNRYGNQYFLAEVWVAGSDIGREFRRSSAEKRLARTGVKRQEAILPLP